MHRKIQKIKISHKVELLRNSQKLSPDNYCISYIRECYIYCINGLFGSGYKFDSLVNLIRVAKIKYTSFIVAFIQQEWFSFMLTVNLKS